jgi:hypothetical protein
VQSDLGPGQGLRHRAATLGSFGLLLKALFVDVRDLRFGIEVDVRDFKAFARFFDMHVRRCVRISGLFPSQLERGLSF